MHMGELKLQRPAHGNHTSRRSESLDSNQDLAYAALPVKLHSSKRTDSRPLLRFFRDEGNQSRTASRNKGKSTAEL